MKKSINLKFLAVLLTLAICISCAYIGKPVFAAEGHATGYVTNYGDIHLQLPTIYKNKAVASYKIVEKECVDSHVINILFNKTQKSSSVAFFWGYNGFSGYWSDSVEKGTPHPRYTVDLYITYYDSNGHCLGTDLFPLIEHEIAESYIHPTRKVQLESGLY